VIEPAVAVRARTSAEEIGFGHSSIPEVGRLLAAFASGSHRVAETGTGTGVAAAWMASALPRDGHLITVEVDPATAAAAQLVVGDLPNVTFLSGAWQELLPPYGPFDLVFHDAGLRPEHNAASIVDLLRPGGVLVKDDMTPGEPIAGDANREFLFGHPKLVATEVLTTPTTSAIIAVRKADT
jgi:predicted O-methyltransferase YrrM